MPRNSASSKQWTRRTVLAAAVLAIACALVIARCSRHDRSDSAPAPVASAPAVDTSVDAAMPAGADARPAGFDSAAHPRRAQAVAAAIDTLHAYLQAVGARDFANADALWQPNRQPAAHDEAGLRDLGPLRALRIQNLAPELPPGTAIPASLEVPVQLVASPERGGAVRLHGHYRVRHDPVRARWEIAGASLKPIIR